MQIKWRTPQKKVFIEIEEFFFFEFRWRPKKKVFTKNLRVFFPGISWRPKKGSNIIQRSDADQSQIIGEDAVKLLGENIPHSPWILVPLGANFG